MENSIVILPFSSDNTDSTHVVLTPEEEQLLGKLKTDDSMTYYPRPKGFQNFADSLWGKNYVILESSIIHKNDSVEIQLQLLDHVTGDSIWTKTIMIGKDELPEMHNRIQQELAQAEIDF
jgi:TolB-like protein